jgi:hypothetical protein
MFDTYWSSWLYGVAGSSVLRVRAGRTGLSTTVKSNEICGEGDLTSRTYLPVSIDKRDTVWRFVTVIPLPKLHAEPMEVHNVRCEVFVVVVDDDDRV